MSHPGSSSRVRSNEIADDLEDTGIEMADDSEISADHDLGETSGLISKKQIVKRKSCIHNTCRICMGIMATAVFTIMLVQLWSNYGDDIKRRVFSPQVVGAGVYDSTGARGVEFGFAFHMYENETLHLNGTKPENDLVQLSYGTPRESSYVWEDDCLRIPMESENQVSVVAWSI